MPVKNTEENQITKTEISSVGGSTDHLTWAQPWRFQIYSSLPPSCLLLLPPNRFVFASPCIFCCCQLQNNTNKTSYNCLSFQHTSSYMPIPPFAGSRWVEEKVLPRRWRLVGSLQRQGSWPEDDDNDHDDDVATGRTAPESLVMIFFVIFYCIGVLAKQGQHNRFSCSTNIPALKKAELDG